MLSPAPQCTGLCMGFPGTGLWLRVWQETGSPPPPSQATAHRTPPRSPCLCFPFKSIQGHPVLWVSSCGGGSHIGQNGACSQLPTLNMGGHRSLRQALPCYLEVAPIVCSLRFAAFLLHSSVCRFMCVQCSRETLHGRKPFESVALV